MNKLAGKTVVVTAGGTREYIDDVRVVTNVSSGALGAKISEAFYHCGCKVHYIHSKGAVMPVLDEGFHESASFTPHQYVTTENLQNTMNAIITAFKVDVVVHSAAVSDFTFDRNKCVKLSSSDTDEFIEFMKQTITPTPKLIGKIKEWNPDTILVGFKFTVGKRESERLQLAKELAKKNKCDFVVSNDKVEMAYCQKHVARLFGDYCDDYTAKIFNYLSGKNEIADNICFYVERYFNKRR